MSIVKPLKALRPAEGRESKIACLPYDVFYDHEVRELIASNPDTFLRVTRSEGEFPEGSEPPREEVFARAKENLERMIRDGLLVSDDEPAFYIYRLSEGGHTQTGVIGLCSIDEYESGEIKRHEKTRPDKVADRTDHIVTLRAQTGLIFLAFRGTDKTRELLAEGAQGDALYDLTCENKIRHQIWRVADTAEWESAFAEVPALYVADGHHRLESARAAREVLRAADTSPDGAKDYDRVVAGIFPEEDLAILPYNRVVTDLNGLSKEEFLDRLRQSFIVSDTDSKTPDVQGTFSMYLDGKWYRLMHNVQYFRQPDPIDRLDVSILQQALLEPILGIDDPRTNKRIAFIGGRRGVEELERLVDSSEAAVAFSLVATSMEDLFAVSDMGEIMPPKSTWFEPKLRDGLIVYQI